MKKKLEQIAKQHLIIICCECKGVKIDKYTWIHESQAHDAGLHHEYMELLLTRGKERRLSHGYCKPCYNLAMRSIYARDLDNQKKIQYERQRALAGRKM